MRRPDCYRYFLCFLPPRWLRAQIADLQELTGQTESRVPIDRSHLSLCVLAEPKERNHFLARRIDVALTGATFSSCVIRLGRVRGSSEGATLFTRGSRIELTLLRHALLDRLAAHGVFPKQEKKNPHITLGYDSWLSDGFEIEQEWVPQEIVLIESEHGLGRHNPLGSWPLLPPRQGDFAFRKWCQKRTRI
jgi:2'-5' RNA ligase